MENKENTSKNVSHCNTKTNKSPTKTSIPIDLKKFKKPRTEPHISNRRVRAQTARNKTPRKLKLYTKKHKNDCYNNKYMM